MISFSSLAKQAEKFVTDNSPVILTGVGVVGAAASAFLSGKASIKAVDVIREEKQRLYREHPSRPATPDLVHLTKFDTVRLVWKDYIPAAGVLGLTIASIVCANRISSRRAAALAAVYSLSQRDLADYKAKVLEKINPNKEREVQDAVAQDRVNGNPPQNSQIIVTGHGDVMCYDMPSDRYFRSDLERLRRIQNDVNMQVVQDRSATLTDLYAYLNLNPTAFSNEVGWDLDHPLEFHFSGTLIEDGEFKGQPCITINYDRVAIRGCNQDPPF